jgi:hypothetical protein
MKRKPRSNERDNWAIHGNDVRAPVSQRPSPLDGIRYCWFWGDIVQEKG